MPSEAGLTDYGLFLTPEEVRGLLEEQNPKTLLTVTHKIAAAYSSQALPGNEQKAAEEIFRLLVRETEVKVRQALSTHLKDSADIPKDIIMALARDTAEVSAPVLQYSEVLDDNDLKDIIRATKDTKRYLAISRRRTLSETVSGSLLDTGIEEVAETLVANTGARLSEDQMVSLIANHQTSEYLMRQLSQRPKLPVTVAEKLLSVVSHTLADTLRQKYSLPGKDIQLEIEKARESETLRLLRYDSSYEEIDKLIGQLIAFNRLTPSLILGALCQGNFQFFEMSLARLANIPVANARTLIKDRGDLGFRAIYNKSGLPDSLFQAVRLLLRSVHSLHDTGEQLGPSRFANRVVEHLLEQAESSPVENLSYIVALVRRAANPL